MQNGVTLFNRARSVVVRDSSLVVNANTSQGNIDRLLDEVALNAILNAGGRADEVRCHPGTREEVMGKMEKWMDGRGEAHRRMMWLSGPAGAGKSAIVQTIAERCQERGIYAANFFFFRGDGTRNHAQRLVATLAYQLLDAYPALNELFTDYLTAKPLICKAPIGEQFKRLISTPIQKVQHPPLIYRPIILIIDGLDECNDKRQQEQVLVALHTLVKKGDSNFRVLIASRAEPNLVMSFNKLEASLESIFLDDEYKPQDDIRKFVIAKFDEIRKVHHLAHTLANHWPEAEDIDAITDKSSGQFIYAATVMRFIEYSTASPALSLLRIHGMRSTTDHSPLAQLDAVYSYIFSKILDLQTVKLMFGAHFAIQNLWTVTLWDKENSFQNLLQHGGYEAVEIESLFADLAPIVKFVPGPHMKLDFYHRSLSDYLLDEHRSGIYHVDQNAFAAEWASTCLKNMYNLESWALTVGILNKVHVATPSLSKSLLDATEKELVEGGTGLYRSAWKQLLFKIYELYFRSDRALYKDMLHRWICFAYANNINMVPAIKGTFGHDSRSFHIYTYYNWYLLAEGVKSALKLHT